MWMFVCAIYSVATVYRCVTLFIQFPYRLYNMYAWSNSTLQRLRLEEELQNRQSVREIVQQLEMVEAARL